MKGLLKEELELLTRDVIKLPTYCDYNKVKIWSGYCILDKSNGAVLRQVSENYNLITNKELMAWVKQQGGKFITYNINKSRETFYVAGYFPEIYVADEFGVTSFISFEIANSYSSRFLSNITLGLYNTKYGTFIKTPLEAIGLLRQKIDWTNELVEENLEAVKSIIHLISISKEWEFSFIPRKLGERYSKVIDYFRVLTNSSYYGHLLAMSAIAKGWEKTSYGVCRNTQHLLYNKVIEHSIKDYK